MLEKTIERKYANAIKFFGGLCLKFVSPGRRNVPDRLVLLPMTAAEAIIVAKYMYFVEFKRPGQKPRKAQEREFERLRAMGYRVDVIDR